jgi:hypothetical protein
MKRVTTTSTPPSGIPFAVYVNGKLYAEYIVPKAQQRRALLDALCQAKAVRRAGEDRWRIW